MKRRKTYVLIVLSFFSTLGLTAQDSSRKSINTLSFKPGFFQLKDEFNYGLVNSGVNLNVGYNVDKASGENLISYSPDFAFGVDFNKGIGLILIFQPVNLFYGLRAINSSTKSMFLGPYIATNYQWELYPQLQSGQMFWFSSIESGPEFRLTLPIKRKLFKVKVSNSLMGWSSRPEPATEKTFFSLKFTDFINNVHSNMNFGSLGLFNHTIFEIELVNTRENRLSFAYEFEYFGYYKSPEFRNIDHSIILKWRIGKSK